MIEAALFASDITRALSWLTPPQSASYIDEAPPADATTPEHLRATEAGSVDGSRAPGGGRADHSGLSA